MSKKNGKALLHFGGIKTERENLEIILYVDKPNAGGINFTLVDSYEYVDINNKKKIRVKSLCSAPDPTTNVCNLNFDFYLDTIPAIPPNEETNHTLFRLDILIPLSHFLNCNYDFFKITFNKEKQTSNGNCNHIENVETEEGIIIFEPPTKNKHKRNQQT